MKELKELTVERLEYLASHPRKAVTIGGDELAALAKIALAAKQDEDLNLPLDYLQGHKDGLEWAARTAEACNPLTSDWLYDEPEELAAAIRKGPEMPPLNHTEQDEYWYEVECYKYKGPAKLCAGNTGPAWYFPGSDLLVDNDEVKVIGRAAAPKPESE